MGYQPNIPQATDQISVSQGDLLGNFQQLDNAFNLNHAALELASGAAGKHIFVEMPNQSASVPVTIANEVGLYCNTDANSGQPEMFFLKQSGSTAPAALTVAGGYSLTGSNYIANGGYSRLPSGILLLWGTGTGTYAGIPITITFPAIATPGFPGFASIYNIQVTNISASNTYSLGVPSLTTTNFSVSLSNLSSFSISYLAIGV